SGGRSALQGKRRQNGDQLFGGSQASAQETFLNAKSAIAQKQSANGGILPAISRFISSSSCLGAAAALRSFGNSEAESQRRVFRNSKCKSLKTLGISRFCDLGALSRPIGAIPFAQRPIGAVAHRWR